MIAIGRSLRLVGGLVGLALAAPATAAAEPPPIPLPECPAAIPVSELTPGQDAVGYSVRRGETVETFDVEILDVMRDGLGPGRDMVIAEASGPVIEEAGADGGGISAGMSGSPVYTLDGELIGALAYGFAVGPSPIGGITPAEDMMGLLGEAPSTTAAALEPVELDRSARRAARSRGASAAQAGAGLNRLPVPLTVSGGLAPRRLAMLRRGAARRGLPFVVTGGASTAAVEPTATVAGGDAFAAALSFGDATMAAIGTTTLVCDGEAVAFGHPFLFAGPTLLGATRANVFAIVDDDAFGPYKLAAPTEPIGIVDRDRLAGIRGVLGAEIPTIPIVQDTVALDTGRTRLDGRTEVVDNEAETDFFLPEAVLTHAFANTDSTFDQIGAGSARFAWTVNGVNERSGKPFELVRTNRFTSRSDITADALFELYMGINSLTAQDLAPVTFAGIELDMEVESTVRQWRIGDVKWAVGNEPFRDVKKIRANPKQRIRARVPLEASDTGRARLVKLQFRAPNRPRLGEIGISGGGRGGGFFIEDLFCALVGLCPKDKQETFRDLLRELANKPRNDELLADLRFGRKSSKVLRAQNRVVAGRDSVKVIMGEERPGPGLPPLPF